MERLTLLTMDQEDLKTLLRQIIREETEDLLKKMDKQSEANTLLTRGETSKAFKISLVTLNKYMKQGRIPYYRIGGRVLFKSGELMKAIESNIKYSRRT